MDKVQFSIVDIICNDFQLISDLQLAIVLIFYYFSLPSTSVMLIETLGSNNSKHEGRSRKVVDIFSILLVNNLRQQCN